MLGELVVLYLFMGGFGAAIMLITATWSLVFRHSNIHAQKQIEAFETLRVRCYVSGFALLCLAACCLLLDLGRPQYAYLLFIRPTASILSFGSFVLLANLLIGGFLAAINLFSLLPAQASAYRLAEVLCPIVSLFMMAYTGMFIGQVNAVALWNNELIPLLFVLSSLSSGFSAIFIIAPLVRMTACLSHQLRIFHRMHLAVLAMEIVALVVFLKLSFSNPYVSESLNLLMSFDGLGAWFVFCLIGAGLLLPLAIEILAAATKTDMSFIPVDVLCIAGGFILRLCIIGAGMH